MIAMLSNSVIYKIIITDSIMTKIVVIFMFILLSGCWRTHSPIDNHSILMAHFDYNLTQNSISQYMDSNNFKVDEAWELSDRVKKLKITIKSYYKRHDGLTIAFTNFGQKNCLSISFYDWRNNGVDHSEVKNELLTHLEQSLPVTKQYPGQTRCREEQQSEQDEAETKSRTSRPGFSGHPS